MWVSREPPESECEFQGLGFHRGLYGVAVEGWGASDTDNLSSTLQI